MTSVASVTWLLAFSRAWLVTPILPHTVSHLKAFVFTRLFQRPLLSVI